MNDTPDARVRPLFVEDLKRISLSLACVNRDRELTFAGHPQLFSECVALHFSRGVVIVIIQPDLTPCDHLWMLGKIHQLCVEIVIKQAGFVWMHTDGCVDEWIFFRNSKSGSVRIGGD